MDKKNEAGEPVTYMVTTVDSDSAKDYEAATKHRLWPDFEKWFKEEGLARTSGGFLLNMAIAWHAYLEGHDRATRYSSAGDE